MHRGTHTADTLGDRPGIARVAADQDIFDAAPHLAGGPGFLDTAAIDFNVDPQMTFDTGDRVDRYTFVHVVLLRLEFSGPQRLLRAAARGSGE